MWPPSLPDFYAFGLPPAACVPDTRAVRSITLGSPTLFELPGHGFVGGETLYFQTSASSGVLPAGLSGTTAYLAVKTSSHFFSVTNLDGSPVTITNTGTGFVNVLQDMEPIILQLLGGAASDVMSRAKAYKPPYSGTVPATLTKIACYLAAFDVATRMRVASPQFSMDDVRKKFDTARADLVRLDLGEPLAETVTDATPNTAEMGGVAVPLRPGDFDLPGDRGSCIA
jgi:hypothetical protein